MHTTAQCAPFTHTGALSCPLQIWDCNGNAGQQWYGGGAYQWYTKATDNKCIDLYAGDTADGKKLEIWDCVASETD
jgi:hypothetical protein